MSTLTKERPASPAAIQRAKFANAFDTLSDHYQFSIKEYQTQKFEIGCEFAEFIGAKDAVKTKRYWEWWNYRWNLESVFIASFLNDFGHVDFYHLMRKALEHEGVKISCLDFINREDDTQVK